MNEERLAQIRSKMEKKIREAQEILDLLDEYGAYKRMEPRDARLVESEKWAAAANRRK